MKTILQNKIKILMAVFLAMSLSAFSGPGSKPDNSKKEYRQEYKSLKGVCNCYKDRNYKQKINRTSARYKSFMLRNHRPQ